MSSRLLQPFRDFGWPAGLLYVADRLMRGLSKRFGLFVYEFTVQPIGPGALLPQRHAKNLHVREIRRGDPDLTRMPALIHAKEARFKQGARCLGAYRKGELVGFSWYCKERYEEDEVRCTYELADKQSSVFDFDLFVLPEHRGGLGFASVWQGVNETLDPQGVRYTFSRVTRFNLASRRAHAHLGAQRIGSAVFLEAWRLQCMLTTLPPYVGVTVNGRLRLTLHVPAGLASAPTATLPLESVD